MCKGNNFVRFSFNCYLDLLSTGLNQELRRTCLPLGGALLLQEWGLRLGCDEMEENAAALHTAINSVHALGRGFDVNFDTRLLYCKGVAGSSVVEIDEDHHTRDLSLYDNLIVPNVSRDIKSSSEAGGRHGSGVCSYNEVGTCYSNFVFQVDVNSPYTERNQLQNCTVTFLAHLGVGLSDSD